MHVKRIYEIGSIRDLGERIRMFFKKWFYCFIGFVRDGNKTYTVFQCVLNIIKCRHFCNTWHAGSEPKINKCGFAFELIKGNGTIVDNCELIERKGLTYKGFGVEGFLWVGGCWVLLLDERFVF